MIGQKNVIGIVTMSLLVFIIAACNPSSQDVYEELSKTEINDNGPVSTIERNDSDEVVKDANMIMTIGNKSMICQMIYGNQIMKANTTMVTNQKKRIHIQQLTQMILMKL